MLENTVGLPAPELPFVSEEVNGEGVSQYKHQPCLRYTVAQDLASSFPKTEMKNRLERRHVVPTEEQNATKERVFSSEHEDIPASPLF